MSTGGEQAAGWSVAVRALCEFTARAGDLDLRFTPAPTALEGMAGHTLVRQRRGAGYEAEISLSGRYEDLRVRGRADGYDPEANQLEEVKTYRGKLDGIRANHRALHWAQAKVYGHLLCQSRQLARLRVALVYFNVGSEEESVLAQEFDATALRDFFDEQCARFLSWARAEAAHRAGRDAALAALRFPHGEFRAGQRELSVAVFRAARPRAGSNDTAGDAANDAAETGRCLLAQAPTGIGKTMGTMFPLLKACPASGLDKLFFLTAKGTGHALALQALDTVNAQLAAGAAPAFQLRVLELQARDKLCEHPDKACHGESCPLAQGFYDRLPGARAQALCHARLDATRLREAAREHAVCPYYLMQEMARWSDVIVGDYNYYYDGSAMLHALAQAHQWKTAVLVDEAHNLLERARRMYTAELAQAALAAARKAPTATPPVQKALQRLQRAWNALNKEQAAPYAAHESVPAGLLTALQRAVAAIAEAMADAPPMPRDPLMDFYFEALRFLALAEQFGPHALFDIQRHALRHKTFSTLAIRNLIPAPHLAERHAAARTTVLFSGTLSPGEFYRDTLGLPPHTHWIDVPGPFRPEQLRVRVAAHVSTRWRDREQSLAPIADIVARQYQSRPGNYLCFFSSFDYLGRAAALLRERHPELPLLPQEPALDDAGRDGFLARFTEDGRTVGLAVLGGAFAEGVDLPGARLIGAFVATLGLPQVNPVNESMRRAMERRFGPGKGYDYTYLYPGLQKVVQAAGRVIRAESDRGTLHLIDDRYRQARIAALLPAWWRLDVL